jgi:hypothetical protein
LVLAVVVEVGNLAREIAMREQAADLVVFI